MTILTQSLELTLNTDLSRDDLRLEFYRGLPVNVRCFVRYGTTAASLVGVQSVTLMVRTSREDTEVPALMSDTIDGADLSDCTLVQWEAGTHEHVTFGFTGAETNLVVTGKKRTLWLVAKAMLTDGREVVLGTGQAVCHESNAIPAGEVPENADPAISVAAGDARYAALEHGHEMSGVDGLTAALAAKADTTTMTGLLAAKAALTDLVNGLLLKADADATATAINAILASLQTKSNAATVTAALALKADLINGLIPTSQLPVTVLLESRGAVANEAEMLTKRGDFGTLVLRADTGIFWAINGSGDGSLLSHWTALSGAAPSSGIQMINNQPGPIVVLGKADVGLSNVPNVDARARSTHTGTQPQSSIVNLAQDLAAKASKVGGLVPLSELGGGRAKVAMLQLIGHTEPGQDAISEVPADGPYEPPPLYVDVFPYSYPNEEQIDIMLDGTNYTFFFSVNTPSYGYHVQTQPQSTPLAQLFAEGFNAATNTNYAIYDGTNTVAIVHTGASSSSSIIGTYYNNITTSGGGYGQDYNPGSPGQDGIPASGGITAVAVSQTGRPVSVISASIMNSVGEDAENYTSTCQIIAGSGTPEEDYVLFTGTVGGQNLVNMTRSRNDVGQASVGVRFGFANDPGYSPLRSVLCVVHYLEF